MACSSVAACPWSYYSRLWPICSDFAAPIQSEGFPVCIITAMPEEVNPPDSLTSPNPDQRRTSSAGPSATGRSSQLVVRPPTSGLHELVTKVEEAASLSAISRRNRSLGDQENSKFLKTSLLLVSSPRLYQAKRQRKPLVSRPQNIPAPVVGCQFFFWDQKGGRLKRLMICT